MGTMKFNLPRTRYIFSILACSFMFHTLIYSTNGYTMSVALHRKLERCCKFDSTSLASNRSDCLRLVESELNRQELTHTRSYKYIRKLWRFMSIVTKKHERLEDKSIQWWSVNASQPESATRGFLIYSRPEALTKVNNSDAPGKTLTRLELLIPFYYVHPVNGCRGKTSGQRNVSVSYNGKRYASVNGAVPYRNILVFRLPHNLNDNENNEKMKIDLNIDQDYMFIHLKGSMLLEYFNMDEIIIDEIRSTAAAKAKARAAFKEKNNINTEKDRTLVIKPVIKKITRQSSKIKRSVKKSKHPKAQVVDSDFCRLHKYVVDLKVHLDMRFLEKPEKIDIGMCSGKCNAIHLGKTDEYSTGRSVLLNLMFQPPNRKLRPRCVPHNMQSLTLLSFIGIPKNKNRISINTLHAAKIVSCRCA